MRMVDTYLGLINLNAEWNMYRKVNMVTTDYYVVRKTK